MLVSIKTEILENGFVRETMQTVYPSTEEIIKNDT